MSTVGIRKLKSHLSEYVRRAAAGESIRVSSHGTVVAELIPPRPRCDENIPAGILELSRHGTARSINRNSLAPYRPRPRALAKTTSRELLDWDRGD